MWPTSKLLWLRCKSPVEGTDKFKEETLLGYIVRPTTGESKVPEGKEHVLNPATFMVWTPGPPVGFDIKHHPVTAVYWQPLVPPYFPNASEF
jgi:hypothetical protein